MAALQSHQSPPSELSDASVAAYIMSRLGPSAVTGSDTHGARYSSILDMWSKEGVISVAPSSDPSSSAAPSTKRLWYSKANSYWDDEDNCSVSDDGVLGGFGHISPSDVVGSDAFLTELKALSGGTWRDVGGRAADCGAGIGRVTRNLLLPRGFATVDLVEQSERLLLEAPGYISPGGEGAVKDDYANKCKYLCLGLQDFGPKEGTYDLIWIQWVIGHLTDFDCVQFLQRCLKGLTSTGFLCIKDNMCEDETFTVDKGDHSVARCRGYFDAIFELAGAEVVHFKMEQFDENILPVPMMALRSKTR